ncbi:MAG: PKD domain-containing protein [Cellvibrionaceae bacterium]
MKILPRNIFSLCVAAVFLAACSGESSQSTSESSGSLALAKDTPMAYVERGVSQTAEANKSRFEEARRGESQTPLELYSPYHFNPGAKLYERSGIDVDAVSNELLTDYFQSTAYDVKDLNVSPDGQTIVFAAHGPITHPTDYTWNIYEFDFETKTIRRVITDDKLANKRVDSYGNEVDAHDTNPAYDQDGNIIFSSNRAAGNPDSPVPNIVPVEDAEFCTKVTTKEDPSLLHSMTSEGEDILQLTYGINHDTHPAMMKDGRIAFIRWSYTYNTDIVRHCAADNNKSISTQDLLKSTEAGPVGMNRPSNWSSEQLCSYKETINAGTKGGKVNLLHTNNYTLLRITADGKSIDQLYETVSIEPSDEQLVSLDRIVQAENGKLVGILKHKINDNLGGNIIELGSPQNPRASKMFGNVAPTSLAGGDTQILPGYLSKNGWFSALWPYRDGTSRLLVSWTQCLVAEGGVSKFCQDAIGDDNSTSKYGLWVFNADDNTRLPVVQAGNNRVFEDVVLSRPQQGLEFPFEPYNPDFVDNLDDSQIVCNYPEPINQAPVANAGVGQSVTTGALVALDGTASTDPEGSPLTFLWSISSQPTGANAAIDTTSATPSFTASQSGTYEFQLVVNDGELNSENEAKVSIIVTPEVVNNTAPVANAGTNKETLVGVAVALDGSGTDNENDPLTYQWSVVTPTGTNVSVFSDPAVASPLITPTEEGTYTLQLIVNDGSLNSAPSFVNVISRYPNRAPVAEAGDGFLNLLKDSTITLNGSATDPDGDSPLNFAWTVLSPNGASLSNANTANPSIVVSQFGTYTLQLIVDDGELFSAPDTVELEVVNRKPVAQISYDNNVELNKVFLNGSGSSDTEGEPLSYSWRFVTIPSGSAAVLSSLTAVNPEFTPDLNGSYEVELIVNDGLINSDASTASITFENNTPPVADAGEYQPLTIGGTYQLDGSGSTDVDPGDELTYQWTVLSPDGVVINNPTSVRPTIDVNAFGNYEIGLVVSDGTATDSDTAQLSFDNVRPVAVIDVQPSQTVVLNTTITLDGSNSTDLNQDPLSYRWVVTAPDNTSVSLLPDAESVTSTFVKAQNGIYTAQLIVNDGLLDSEPATVEITSSNSKPIADPGEYNDVSLGESLELDGSGSRDDDGDTLTFQWSLLSKPDNSLTTLINITAEKPTLQNIDQYGDYVVQLIVNDGTENSDPETALISSENLKPIAVVGDDINNSLGQVASLDGSNSYDPNEDEITFSWSFNTMPEGSSVAFDDATAAQPNFTPDIEGLYVAQLIVSDGQLFSDPKTVNVLASAVACIVDDSNQRTIPVTIRDFTVSHLDFESDDQGFDPGIVTDDLGSDGLPVYAHGDEGTRTTHGPDAFNQWYRDVSGVNLNIPMSLTMTRESDSTTWEFSDGEFFPIDDDLLPTGATSWGNTPLAIERNLNHNFHFTLETHLEFDYQGGETFTFRGDDDLWVYINGKLVIDIGGVHNAIERTVNLDEVANEIGIEVGNTYSFDLFFAERHLTKSNFHFQTSINLTCTVPE